MLVHKRHTHRKSAVQLQKQQQQMKHLRQPRFLTRLSLCSCLLYAMLLLLMQSNSALASVHPVQTYKNASTELGQRVTSSTLVWQSYDRKDPKQLENAVEGGKYITDEEHYSIYVCRVRIEGVPTSGHTEKIAQSHVCVPSHYKHAKYDNFDVLINKGHLGKIAWKPWRKFNAGIPVGAICIEEDAYIARHRAPITADPSTEGVEEHHGADYNLGRLDPVGLGKIKVVENKREKYYDEGEVLIETEPYLYELRDIKLDKIRLDMRENITEMASRTLSNTGNQYSVVEAVMSYEYDYVQYWGTHEGAARGLPTMVYEKDIPKPAEINWGLKYLEKRFETKSVHTKLWPGTALNVTMQGIYVTLEAPYSAKLIAHYYGSNDTVSRKISADVRKNYLKDVKMEFSNVYWIENGTFVPTTTTSTTSTTSTTTRATTTSTHEPTPMHEPPVVHVKNIGDTKSGPDTLEKSLHDTVASNEISSDVPENLAEQRHNLAIAGVGAGSNSATSIDGVAQACYMAALAAILAVTTLRTV